MSIQFVHVNLIAKDWKKLADFYINVFGCIPVLPERHLSGEWIDAVTQFKDVQIDGVHLALPGFQNEPKITLEIFQYNQMASDTEKALNQPGFAHIAFHVDDIAEILRLFKLNGGRALGKLVEKEMPGLGLLSVVYARDPEGNIVELQTWKQS